MKRFILPFLIFLGFSSSGQLAPAALGFNGVEDRVTIPSNAQYVLGTGDFTVEFWFRSSTVAGGAPYSSTLFYLGNGSTNGIGVYLTNGRPNFSWGNTSTGGTSGGPDFRDSACHHLAFRRTANVLTYVIDGVVCPITNTTMSLNASGPITIGHSIFNNPFKGSIKEVRFWKRSLTQQEIINGFNQVYNSSAFLLTGYWRFNSTSGQTVTDYSMFLNHGVLGTTSAIEATDAFFTNACPSCTPPSATIAPSTTVVICTGDSVLLTANTGTGFTYQWYKNGSAIVGATGVSYYAKQDGLHYVRVKNAAGCEAYSLSKDIVVPSVRYINLISNRPIVGGSTCLNSGYVVLTAAGGNSFLWYKNGVSTGQISNSITINSSQAGSYSCRIIASQCTVMTNAVNVKYFTSTITTPFTQFCNSGTTISMTNNYGSWNGVFMQNGIQAGIGTFASTSVSGPIYYTENNAAICPVAITSNTLYIMAGAPPALEFSPEPAYSQAVGRVIDTCVNQPGYIHNLEISGYSPSEVTQFNWTGPVNMSNYWSPNIPVTVNGFYQCSAASICGTGISQPACVRILNAAAPPVITGNNTGCPSVFLEMSNIYDSYQWKLNGTDIAGAIYYSYTATQSGTYTCLISNTCGSLLSAPKTITLKGPGATLTTSQPYNLCNGSKTLFANPSGYTYKWLKNNVLIPGATAQQYIASTSGNYRVIITNSCKSDTSNTINLASAGLPSTPGAMTGPTRVCPGNTGVVFSIPAVANATTYQWVIPAGMTATTPTWSATALSVTVNVSASYVNGDIQVRAGNACGWGPYRTKNVKTIIPASPGSVTGPTYGVCNSTQSYSIAAVSQATTYLWVPPAGASILSGQGTTAVTISFPSNYNSDTVRVSAGNSCAFGPVRKVVVRGRPQTPSTITGPSTACNGQAGVLYSIAPVFGALTYIWSAPSGATITNGQGTVNATIKFGASNGSVSVKASNGCGLSGVSSKAVTINCRESGVAERNIEIYPNPSRNEFSLIGVSQPVYIQVYDMTGKEIFSGIISEEDKFGNEFVPGIYVVHFRNNDKEHIIRIVKM